MDLSIFFPLISEVLVFLLSIIVFRYGKKTKIRTTFLFFLFFINIWMFGTFMMFFNKTFVELVIFWDKIVYTGVVFIPVAMLNFAFAITNKNTKKTKFLIAVGYFISVCFLLLIPGELLISGANIYSWGAHSRASFFHTALLVYYAFYLFVWFIAVFRYYLNLKEAIEKQRVKYSLFAFFQFTFLGLMGFLPAYGINIYPISYISGLIFVGIITYAIISYKLMDIKLVLRKSAVFLFSSFTTVLLFLVVKVGITTLVSAIPGWIDLIIIVCVLAVYPYTREYYQYLANKYFFTSLYDAKKIIAELGDELSATLEPHIICRAVEKHLTNSLHPKAIALFDFNEKTTLFDVKFNYGFKFTSGSLKVAKYVQKNYFFKNNVLSLEDMKSNATPRVAAFINDFQGKLGVEVVVPMVIKDKVVGFLALGPKESNDVYNGEDVQLLSVVGNQVAMSLENSWLYEETKKFNIKLTKEVESATHDLREANAELKKLDEAKSEFISIASHQLRTPLTVIKGYASMILEGDMGKLPAGAIEDSMKKIYESNERLIALVEDLLNISRIESGRMKYDFVEENLESVVDSVIDELQMNAKAKNLYLKYDKPTVPTSKIKLDKMKLRQVAMNIIDNALKYTPTGGVTVKLFEQGDRVLMTVTDTGMGINPADLPHLFKKFTRGENSATVHTEGTGLGLYVGKMMIEEHGGTIRAESAGDNQGSTFTIELPLVRNSQLTTLKTEEKLTI